MIGKRKISFHISESFYLDAKAKADMSNNTVSSVIREALACYLYGDRVKE